MLRNEVVVIQTIKTMNANSTVMRSSRSLFGSLSPIKWLVFELTITSQSAFEHALYIPKKYNSQS